MRARFADVFLSFFGLLGLLPALGCAPAQPPPLAHVASPRIVLAPVSFDTVVPESLEPGLDILDVRIAAYLEARGCQVDQPGFTALDDLWQESGATAGELYDRDGEPIAERYDRAMGQLVAALREEASFDAVVLPYLLSRVAKVRGQTGVWDGSRERVRLVWEHRDRFQMEAVGMELPATSLRVFVFGPDGQRIYEATEGLQLAAEVVIKDSSYVLPRARTDLFEDGEDLDRGIREALAPVFE